MREAGFYWVKGGTGWFVASWDSILEGWEICGSKEIFTDYEIGEIGPKLEPPE